MKNINQGYVLEKKRVRAASGWISQKAFQSKGILQILRAELQGANEQATMQEWKDSLHDWLRRL